MPRAQKMSTKGQLGKKTRVLCLSIFLLVYVYFSYTIPYPNGELPDIFVMLNRFLKNLADNFKQLKNLAHACYLGAKSTSQTVGCLEMLANFLRYIGGVRYSALQHFLRAELVLVQCVHAVYI